MINSDANNRGDVAEVIITNVPPEQQQQQNIQDYI
jgi:DNA adenine methylase